MRRPEVTKNYNMSANEQVIEMAKVDIMGPFFNPKIKRPHVALNSCE